MAIAVCLLEVAEKTIGFKAELGVGGDGEVSQDNHGHLDPVPDGRVVGFNAVRENPMNLLNHPDRFSLRYLEGLSLV